MEALQPFDLAQAALALEHKLAALSEHMDPRRLHAGSAWAAIDRLPDAPLRRRLAARVFLQRVGPWPALARLHDRPARLVMLDGPGIVRQLCLLALAGRPGALRGCVDREVRTGLQAALGPAWDTLATVAERGRIVGQAATAWTPLHWACLGYCDWTGLLQRGDSALRRLVRLSLPPGLLGVRRRLRALQPDLPPAQALALLDELGLEWPC